MPDKLDAALDRLLEKHGFSPPLSDLFHSEPYDVLRRRIQFGLYLGLHAVDGVRCHHLSGASARITARQCAPPAVRTPAPPRR